MPKPNDYIGPYQLIRRLGKGTFGEVWLAQPENEKSPLVAVKLPNDPELDFDALLQETAVWARAGQHPNVVEFLAARVFDQQAVIVSEYVPDGSLEEWLKRNGGRAPSIESAIEMICGILDGLEHLHSKSIIHRDLKPANILMHGNTPRLADFGHSRVLASTIHGSMVVGAPAYMSPEAFDAVQSEQTDLWSIGVLLYQMLAGRKPFPQRDPASLMKAIMMDEPHPLPADLPGWLRPVIEKAMSKEPAQRYQSAAEMRAALLRSAAQPFRETPEVDELVKHSNIPQPTPLIIERRYVSNEATAPDGYVESNADKNKIIVWQKRVGRNDPCPCGSGKKYKICCSPEVLQLEPIVQSPERLEPQNEQPTSERGKVVVAPLPKERVGRNDPCPCGSGKKYKKCCSPEVLQLEPIIQPPERLEPENEQPTIERGKMMVDLSPKPALPREAPQRPEPKTVPPPKRQPSQVRPIGLGPAIKWGGAGLAAIVIAVVAYVATRPTTTISPNSSGSLASASSPRTNLGDEFAENLNGVKLLMKRVPDGSFMMGAPDNERGGQGDEVPQHRVTVPSFYIGKYEVTQAQWKAVMGGDNPSYFKGDDLPVEEVSWNDAKEFCRKLGQMTEKAYRLPSEAEWEYACRAGTAGDYAGNLNAMAWYDKNSGGKTHPVGQKQPNRFGLFDMHGNVWEWCEDFYHGRYTGAPVDGSAWLTDGYSAWPYDGLSYGGGQPYRVLRGGSWNPYSWYVRSSKRGWSPPSHRGTSFGVRVVLSPRTLNP